MKLRFLFPLVIFIGVISILWRGLSLHPNEIPSPLINRAAPAFALPSLLQQSQTITNQILLGHVTLVNVWATWCFACGQEHDFLLAISRAPDRDFELLGLNYKDDPVKARAWLTQHGNPYQQIAVDASGDTAINWGVYGSPETFILDKKGIIRYKQIGPITASVWEQTLKPLLAKLRRET